MRVIPRILIAVLALIMTGYGMQSASAAAPPSAAIGGSHSHGLEANPVLGALSAKWWKYALETSAAKSPLNDKTGADCRTRQSGQVFFLVGTAGGGSAVRDECTVPYGKALFFPIANAFDVSTPNDGLDTPELIWQDLQVTFGFEVTAAYASVDGVKLPGLSPQNPLYRGCVGQDRGCFGTSFSFNLPNDNLLGIDQGTYKPAVADGVYALLPPLRKGKHTIVFNGEGFLGAPFSSEITYHITVN